MNFTISSLRENIYNILDNILETGVPIFIRRKGKILKIVVEGKVDKLEKLKSLPKRDIICDDPDDLIHIDWSSEWKKDYDLS